MTTYEYRPECLLMPELDPEVFDALVEDIKTNGLHSAVILHPDGRVLDGRHRLRACQQLGLEARFVVWQGEPGTELEWVLGENLYRRHLTSGQRAVLAMEVFPKLKAEGLAKRAEQARVNNSRLYGDGTLELPHEMSHKRVPSHERAARIFGTNASYISQAAYLFERSEHHDLLEAVRNGAVLERTYREAKARDDAPSEDYIIDHFAGVGEHIRRGWAWAYRGRYGMTVAEILEMWEQEATYKPAPAMTDTPTMGSPTGPETADDLYTGPDLNTTAAERELDRTQRKLDLRVPANPPEPVPLASSDDRAEDSPPVPRVQETQTEIPAGPFRVVHSRTTVDEVAAGLRDQIYRDMTTIQHVSSEHTLLSLAVAARLLLDLIDLNPSAPSHAAISTAVQLAHQPAHSKGSASAPSD